MRTIPDPGFAGDDGAAPAALTEALTRYAADSARYGEVLRVLQHSRLLVPVVARLDEAELGEDGLAREKSSHMATVLMRGRDGRLALLAFTSTDTLAAWNPQGRPVPAPTSQVARAALQDGAAAVLIDVAGPVRFVLEERDVRALAGGFSLVEVDGGLAWARTTDSVSAGLDDQGTDPD